MACTAAAVGAPVVMAATVSNANPGAVATYALEGPETAAHHLVLGPDPAGSGKLLFNDTIAPINPVPLGTGLGEPETCVAPGAGSQTATCPGGSPVAVTLGPSGDTLELQDGVDNANVDAGDGIDQLDLHARTGAETVKLTDTAPTGAPAGLTFADFETVAGGQGADRFVLPNGPVTITGGDAADRLDFSQRSSGVSVDLGATTVAPGVTAPGIEDVTGSAADDILTGDAAANSLDGAGGRNMLRGGDGNDTLKAGTDSAGDVLVGDAGTDTFVGAASTNILALDKAPDVITCSADRTDTVVADLGVNGIRDQITNPDACGTVTGPVRVDPGTSTAGAGTTTSETLQPIIVVPRLGSIAPVLAPGKADVADLTPPGASMRTFSRQRIATVLGKAKGVRVRVTCKESCGISIALSVDRATAKRLKLDTRTTPVVIGTASATRIVAGSTVLKVKLTPKAKKALKASKRNVTANTQVLVSDASGNGTLLSRHVTLVR